MTPKRQLASIGKQIRSCETKITYSNRRKAVAAADKVSLKKRSLTEYHCPICGLWHLTSHNQR